VQIELELKINQLKVQEPAEFEKLYLAMEKLWTVQVINCQQRLRELGLIP
jgi:hypothetical protein